MIAFLFPGQGSQKPEMGRELFENHVEAQAVFERVSAALGFDVAALCFTSDEETLRQTQNAQVALFTCGVAAAEVAKTNGIRPAGVAGHSVGEYAALVIGGVLEVEAGARLVRARGLLMAEAGTTAPGTMAAIIGLDREPAEAACREAGGAVVVANDNSPGQLVISGEAEAVARAGELAKEKGAKRVIPLNVSGAFHSPLMRTPALGFAGPLGEAHFAKPALPVFSNVTAAPEEAGWAELLKQQLESPVRWTESMQAMRERGFTTFVECGSGEVLCGLMKRIDRAATSYPLHDLASLGSVRSALGTE